MQGIIFCCEVKNKKSKEDILLWKNSVESRVMLDYAPIIIMENKCDLLGEEEKYNDSIEELKQFSENNGFSGFFRTSALNGYNIEKAIDFLLGEMLKILEENKKESESDSISSFLYKNSHSKKSSEKNGKCCWCKIE